MDGPLQPTPNIQRTDTALRPSGVLDQTPLVSFTNQPPPKDPNLKRQRIRRLLAFSLISIGILIGIALLLHNLNASKQTLNASLEKTNPSLRFKPQTTSLSALAEQLTSTSQTTSTLTINGNIAVNGSVVLQPSTKPAEPTAGQLYYDQTANQVGYYDGVGFVYLQGAGGASSVTNNFITNVTNISGSGLAGNGQTGQLAFFNSPSSIQGSLLSQSGTTVTATAALRLQSTTNSTAAFQVKNIASQNVVTINTTNGQLVLGNDSATPTATTIRAGAGVGNDVTGVNFIIQGSNGTGGANGGDVILETGQSAQGGIQLDNADKVVSSGGLLSMSFTVGTHQGRLLMVMTNYAATGLTYDGRPLTLLASAVSGQGFASGVDAKLWYLLNPPSGTFTLSTTNGGAGTTMGAASYYNVNQTTPFGTPVTAIGANAGTQATSLAITTTSTSQIVVDGFALDRDSSTDSCTPLTPGETVRWAVSQFFFTTGCGADVAATGGLMNLSWQSTQADWAEAAVVLNPAVPGSTPLQIISGSNPNTMFDRLHITATGNIGINNSNPQYALDVNGAINTTTSVYAPIFDTPGTGMLNIGNFNASSIQLGNSTSNIITSVIGTMLVQPTPGNDSTTAFQIQAANSTPLFTADTAGMHISITGTPTTFATLSLANAHLTTTQTTAPTAATPTNCGSGSSTAVTAGSTDVAGSFTITTGTGAPTTCDTTITLNATYGSPPKSVILMPTSAIGGATGSLTARVSAVGATSFTIQIAPTNAAASTIYSFYYIIAG
ncbi:MAG TPA: hypothetical protein VLG92_03475 [Candidatus Saccharimonadia bacterium]|nr:hypothetical protein [Candidatus Saccharimonadia bacterium]